MKYTTPQQTLVTTAAYGNFFNDRGGCRNAPAQWHQ